MARAPDAPREAGAASLSLDALRQGDPDLYAASLFLPAEAQAPVRALIAFNLEIVKVRDMVSEPMLGEIRHQWWRDAITNSAPAGHPVAQALVAAITDFDLDKEAVLDLIEAHSFDLYDDPMASTAAFDGYVRDVSRPLFDLTAQILAAGFPPHPAVEAAARAYAITKLLRDLPFQIMRRQLFLPLDRLAAHGCAPESVLAHQVTPELGAVLAEMRGKARAALSAMRVALPTCPTPLACLPAFLCEPYLKRMERPGFDPFQQPVELLPWLRLWTLWRASRRL